MSSTYARVLGITLSLLWMIPMVGAIVNGEKPSSEGVVLAVLVASAIAATVVGFRRPRIGGWTCVVAGLALSAFALFSAGRNHWLAVLVSGLPWIVVGALFVRSARLLAPEAT